MSHEWGRVSSAEAACFFGGWARADARPAALLALACYAVVLADA